MKRLMVALAGAGLAIVLMSCGGNLSNGGGGQQPPPPVVTTVTLTCSSTAILLNQTSACTVKVEGTGNFNPAVTYAVTSGSVSGSGVFTPATTGTATVTARSVQTPSVVSNSVEIAVSISVAVAPATATLSQGQSQQFSATVNGTSNQSVTWSVVGLGSIASSGLYAAPAKIAAKSSDTIVATSQVDGSTQGTATVVLTPPCVPTITAITPSSFYLPPNGAVLPLTFTGTCFADGDTVALSQHGQSRGTAPEANTSGSIQFTYEINLARDSYVPGFINFTVSNSAGTSNPGTVALLGDVKTSAKFGSSDAFFLQQGSIVDTTNVVTHFLRGAVVGKFPVGLYKPGGIAVDDATESVVVAQGPAALVAVFPQGGGFGSGSQSDGDNPAYQVAAHGGFAYVPVPGPGHLCQVDLNNLVNPLLCVAVGTSPYAIDLSTSGATTVAVVMTQENPSLYRVDGASMKVKDSVSLPGCTSASKLNYPEQGGWHVVVLNNGPAANTAAALCQADGVLTIVDLSGNQMTVAHSIVLNVIPGMSGVPFRIAGYEANGAILVAFADPTGGGSLGLTRVASVDVATGNITVLNATSSLLGIGFEVMADGIYVMDLDTADVLPVQ